MAKKLTEILINVLLVLAIFAGMYFLVKEIRQPEVAMQPQQIIVQQPMAQPQTVVQQQPVALPDKTYFSEYSCSDLASCTVTKVPEGLMTIGFIRVNRGTPDHNCGYVMFRAGQEIDYTNLNEIHTYSGNLPDPSTTLDAFVENNMPFVHACN